MKPVVKGFLIGCSILLLVGVAVGLWRRRTDGRLRDAKKLLRARLGDLELTED